MTAHSINRDSLNRAIWKRAFNEYEAAAALRRTVTGPEDDQIDAIEEHVARAYRSMLATRSPTIEAVTDKLSAVHTEYAQGDALPAEDVAVVLANLKYLGTA